MQHIHPDMTIGLHPIRDGAEKSHGIQMPLGFLELDLPGAERVAEQDIGDDHGKKNQPDPGESPAASFDEAVNCQGKPSVRQVCERLRCFGLSPVALAGLARIHRGRG